MSPAICVGWALRRVRQQEGICPALIAHFGNCLSRGGLVVGAPGAGKTVFAIHLLLARLPTPAAGHGTTTVLVMLRRRCVELAEQHPGFRAASFTPHDFRRFVPA